MPKYGLIANGEFVRSITSTTPPDGDWRLFHDVEQPPHDPETEEVVELSPLVEAGSVLQQWQVLPLAERRPGAGQVFMAPVPIDPNAAPNEVRTWALREVCLERGLEPAIEDALSKLDPLTKAKAENRWKAKPTISRASEYIVVMQRLLGWTDVYVDQLFRDADAKPL